MQSLEEKTLWQERWQSGHSGWDQGEAHPGLSLLIEHARREGALPKGGKFFSAGCGRAHSEAVLADWAYDVTAIDLSPTAIAEAEAIYGKRPGLVLKVADLFQLEPLEAKGYDAIFDRAMLCALAPETRAPYIEAMKARLKDKGLFCAILFRTVHSHSHPPYAIDEAEAFRLLAQDFVLCYAAALPGIPVPAAVKGEWICIWRLRGALDEN